MDENDPERSQPEGNRTGGTGTDQQEPGPRVSRDEVRDLGRLRRSSTDRHLAGVAGGIGRHLDIDPVIVRVALVVLAFFGGAGLLLYATAWLLVPEEGTERAVVDLDPRTRGVALLLAVGLGVLLTLGDSWGGPGFPWPLAVVGLIVLLVLTRPGRQRSGTDASDGPGAPAWAPPTTAATTRPRDPRKRGPVHFWFTLAAIVLSLALLGVVDAAGLAVPDAAYPALALGWIGVMLLLGAWWGRAGGLIALGLVAALVLAGTTVSERTRLIPHDYTPETAAAVQDDYWLPAGEVQLDLTDIDDLSSLDGRDIEVGIGTGRIEVVVPEEVDLTVHAEAGLGQVWVLGEQRDGFGPDLSGTDPGTGPEVTIRTHVGAGEIEVRTE